MPIRRLGSSHREGGLVRNPLAVASAVAVLCALLLGVVVWRVAAPPAAPPAAVAGLDDPGEPGGVAPAPTPTVRVIARNGRRTAAGTPEPREAADASTRPRPTAAAPPSPPAPRATTTPRPRRAARATSTAAAPAAATRVRPTPSPTPTPLYVAEDAAGFAPLATYSWAVRDDRLVNEGQTITGEPWTTAPFTTPPGPFAVEAEMRATGTRPDVCNQSFGLVVASGGLAWGAGPFYPCDGSGTVARLTDVSDPGNGYDLDRAIAQARFDPGTSWHAYRLEVDGGRLRLLVDGEEVLDAVDATARTTTPATQVGLWSQGTAVVVRKLAVTALPES